MGSATGEPVGREVEETDTFAGADALADADASEDAEPAEDPEGVEDADALGDPHLGWWRRDHPVFAAVAGFYAGIACVTLLPALYVGVLHTLGGTAQVERHFWWLLLVLLVPVWLVVSGRSRRAGLYMLLGMVVTCVVVLGVGGAVLWVVAR